MLVSLSASQLVSQLQKKEAKRKKQRRKGDERKKNNIHEKKGDRK